MTDSSTLRTAGPPIPTVWPCVGFTDVEAGIRFLTDGLGFVVSVVHRDGDGAVEHAEARWPDGGGVMFGSRGKPGAWGALGPQGIYVVAAEISTVDAAWKRVSGMAGIEVLQELHDTDYGSHEFGIQDADANLWTVGTYRGA